LIITVVLNPIIHETYYVEELQVGQKNWIKDQEIEIQSAGVHAAKVIKILQGEPLVHGFLGELNGRYIKNELDRSNIKSNFGWIVAHNQVNTTIIEKKTEKVTILSNRGIMIGPKEEKYFRKRIHGDMQNGRVMILGNNIPEGITSNLYYDLIIEGKKQNIKTILATEGEQLIKGLEANPYAIKITEEGLLDLNIEETSHEKIVEYLYPWVQKGIHYLALDLGVQGAYLLSKNKICYIEPPEKDFTHNPLATHAFLGAFAVGIERKYEQEKIAKLAVATSLAFMEQESEGPMKKSDIDIMFKKVKVREIKQ